MNINLVIQHTMNNKKALSFTETAGCYQCLNIFAAKEITEWTDQGQTAICPFCATDSVLADSPSMAINEDLLKQIKEYWLK